MFKSAQTVTILSVFTQAIAFLRTVIIAATFGASGTVDGYFIGLAVPTFITMVMLGWLQISFAGRYKELLTIGDKSLARLFRSRLLWLLIGLALLCSVIFSTTPRVFIHLLLDETQQNLINTATDVLRISSWMIVPILVGEYLGLILNSHGRFFLAAFGPLINVFVSVVFLWAWPNKDLSVLTWTLVLGGVSQLLIVSIGVLQLRLPFSTRTKQAAGEVKAASWMALTVVPAMMLTSVIPILVQIQFAYIGEGAVAVFGYASRLHGALSQVLIIGLSTVLLPHFAGLCAQRDYTQIHYLLRRIARLVTLVSICLTVGIALFGVEAVELLLGRGRFDEKVAADVALVWALLSAGLLPFLFGTVVAKLAQSMRKTVVVLISSMIGFCATWAVIFYSSHLRTLELAALAPAIAFGFTMVFWVGWYMWKISAPVNLIIDLISALIRSSLIVAPAVLLDNVLFDWAQSLANAENLFLRGLVYTAIVGSVFLITRQRGWFLMNSPKR